jgi:hypothetical protein
MLSLNCRKDFFCRISEDRDSNKSSLYEVPSSDSAVGVPIIVGCQAAFAALRNSTGYFPKSFGYAYTSASCRTSTRDDDPGLGHEIVS